MTEFADKGWQLGSIDSTEENPQECTTVRQPGSGKPRMARSSGGPRAQSGGQSPKRHRSDRELSHESGIPHLSVHRIIEIR